MDPISRSGTDLTVEAGEHSTTISWHKAHLHFVIILVGAEGQEEAFGIQKDLLMAQSAWFREQLHNQENLEKVIKLPECDVDTFGCFQNFIYTGAIYDKKGGREIPDYALLLRIWNLATKLKMAPFRIAVLEVMAERRQLTSMIPGTELLIQAWGDTEEGSGLRKMLIGWTAEHMHASNHNRNIIVRSLPKEILEELVTATADITSPPAPAHPAPVHRPQQGVKRSHHDVPIEVDNDQPQTQRPAPKRARKSDVGVTNGADEAFDVKHPKKVARKSEPSIKRPYNRKVPSQPTIPGAPPPPMDPDTELAYCKDLIQRMISGPGFWTRLVGPFKEPVDPIQHNIPNYFDVVKRPMDLRTIKNKMDASEYKSAEEFEKDIRLIFQNCFEYWTPEDQVWKECENFERYFNEKWGQRYKWVTTVKPEAID